MATGATGVECRGSEHEVTLILSSISGKRLVVLDGIPVHFSAGRRTEGKFQYSWAASVPEKTIVLTIIAYAINPLRSIPAFKQFDLIINGQSYIDMCHINELGVYEDHTKNHELAVAGNIGYDAIIHPPTREEKVLWVERLIKIEQKRDNNQAGPTPPSRLPSLPIRARRETNRVVPSRTNNVTFAPEFLSGSTAILSSRDLLSAILPVEIRHNQTPTDDYFNSNQPPSDETIWNTFMDAYDSDNTNRVDASSAEIFRGKIT